MNQYMTHQSRSKDEAYHLAQVIPDHVPSSEYSRIKTRMLCHLFEQQVFPHLQNGKTYGVKLDIRQEPFRSYNILSEGTQIDMRVTMYQADQRIIEFVDYRPMNWMTLSQTAMEEIKHASIYGAYGWMGLNGVILGIHLIVEDTNDLHSQPVV
jgi:hypothetical protein